tara:strand:- start:5639 stop:5932 length:294 start_codon:yes stop_codon:yes gene_type:complete
MVDSSSCRVTTILRSLQRLPIVPKHISESLRQDKENLQARIKRERRKYKILKFSKIESVENNPADNETEIEENEEYDDVFEESSLETDNEINNFELI